MDAVAPEDPSEESNCKGRAGMGRCEKRGGVGESRLPDEKHPSFAAGQLDSRSRASSWDAGSTSCQLSGTLNEGSPEIYHS